MVSQDLERLGVLADHLAGQGVNLGRDVSGTEHADLAGLVALDQDIRPRAESGILPLLWQGHHVAVAHATDLEHLHVVSVAEWDIRDIPPRPPPPLGRGHTACLTRKLLLEPEERGFTILAGDVIHRSTVTQAVPELRQLAEPDPEKFLRAEQILEVRPERLGRDEILQVTEIGVYQLSREGASLRFLCGRRITPSHTAHPLVELLRDGLRELKRAGVDRVADAFAKGKFHRLDPQIEVRPI